MAIKRIWRGWTTKDNADAYEALLCDQVFPGIEARNIAGYRGIELLRRDLVALDGRIGSRARQERHSRGNAQTGCELDDVIRLADLQCVEHLPGQFETARSEHHGDPGEPEPDRPDAYYQAPSHNIRLSAPV